MLKRIFISFFSEIRKIPMFGGTEDSDLKAVIAYSTQIKKVRDRFAAIVMRVLKGEDINTMPFDNTETNEKIIKIDKKTSKTIGFKLPDSIVKKADIIIG